MFYLLYKHQWNTKPFHFNSFLVWKAWFICSHSKGDIFTCEDIKFSHEYFIDVYIINIDIISPHCFYLKEEQRRQHRKIARKEKKQKTAVDDGDIDPDLAATMGFSGFGSTKK